MKIALLGDIAMFGTYSLAKNSALVVNKNMLWGG